MPDLTRRDFVAASLAAAGAKTAALATGQDSGETPAAINEKTIAEAERLAGLSFTDAERKQIAETASEQAAGFESLRSRSLPNELAPATTFRAAVPPQTTSRFVRSTTDPGPPPRAAEDIAYAPLTSLSRWIEHRAISSEQLTRIYLERIERLGPKLECIVTVTADHALAQARAADHEIASGRYRGPLHGIPWGAKDLFDTAGIRTTWGATPYRDRVPDSDADVVERLDAAGAVLVAKTTLGALAYGDQWFGGRTNNPWNLAQGSSGSSAGSAAGTAAGLFGFSLGTETYGSIVSPSMRCGTTGLRPTFGRVARGGAMALCWSLDKVGPITRTVEDSMLVLEAINGASPRDRASIDAALRFDANAPLDGVRIGFSPSWFERRVTSIDRNALEVARTLGAELVEVELPDWPYDALLTALYVEAAAAFDELTRTDRDDELLWQDPVAWPNTFRSARFIPAVELVQADRFRTEVCSMMDGVMDDVDVLVSPSFAANLLLITNFTGHPCLTLRAGFSERGRPQGITLWGRHFDEGRLARVGMELESRFDVWDRRPAL